MQAYEKIQLLREHRRISQEYMALVLGITQSSYSRIESGQTFLKEKMKLEILAILTISPIDFERWDGTFNLHFSDSKGDGAGQGFAPPNF